MDDKCKDCFLIKGHTRSICGTKTEKTHTCIVQNTVNTDHIFSLSLGVDIIDDDFINSIKLILGHPK